MPIDQCNGRACLVSFSGIDGAGKSTQIDTLCDRLRGLGLHVEVLRFWDDIARVAKFREDAGHAWFKGDKGIGTPSAPINRRDKNIQSWPMTAARLFIYFLDAFSTRAAVTRALRSDADLVIFDRYIYDELANLRLDSPVIRLYVRQIMKLVPRPHISYLLDADPEAARVRKPEYPLDFLRMNRQAYLALAGMIGGITVIRAMPLEGVAQAVFSHTFNMLPSQSLHRVGEHAVAPFQDFPAPAKMDGALTH